MIGWTRDTLHELYRTAGVAKAPKIAIETGTYKGNSAIALSKFFKQWHTIDIDPKFTKLAQRRCAAAGVTNVVFHTGDSQVVLPELIKAYSQPVCFFLDAHYSRTPLDPVTGKHQMDHHEGADFPLFAELTVLGERSHPDIIVIDDWGLAGKEPEGCRAPGDSSPQWNELSVAAVLRITGKPLHAFRLRGTMVFHV